MYPSKGKLLDLRDKIRTPTSKTKQIYNELQKLGSLSSLRYSVTSSFPSNNVEVWRSSRKERFNTTIPPPKEAMNTPSRLQEYSLNIKRETSKPYWRGPKLNAEDPSKPGSSGITSTKRGIIKEFGKPTNVITITDDDLLVDDNHLSEDVLSRTIPLPLSSTPAAGFLSETAPMEAYAKMTKSVGTTTDDSLSLSAATTDIIKKPTVFSFAPPVVRGPVARRSPTPPPPPPPPSKSVSSVEPEVLTQPTSSSPAAKTTVETVLSSSTSAKDVTSASATASVFGNLTSSSEKSGASTGVAAPLFRNLTGFKDGSSAGAAAPLFGILPESKEQASTGVTAPMFGNLPSSKDGTSASATAPAFNNLTGSKDGIPVGATAPAFGNLTGNKDASSTDATASVFGNLTSSNFKDTAPTSNASSAPLFKNLTGSKDAAAATSLFNNISKPLSEASKAHFVFGTSTSTAPFTFTANGSSSSLGSTFGDLNSKPAVSQSGNGASNIFAPQSSSSLKEGTSASVAVSLFGNLTGSKDAAPTASVGAAPLFGNLPGSKDGTSAAAPTTFIFNNASKAQPEASKTPFVFGTSSSTAPFNFSTNGSSLSLGSTFGDLSSKIAVTQSGNGASNMFTPQLSSTSSTAAPLFSNLTGSKDEASATTSLFNNISKPPNQLDTSKTPFVFGTPSSTAPFTFSANGSSLSSTFGASSSQIAPSSDNGAPNMFAPEPSRGVTSGRRFLTANRRTRRK